jgi:hypothetical protein
MIDIILTPNGSAIGLGEHEYAFDFGNHEVQVSAGQWTKVTLPPDCICVPVCSRVIRLKYDDQREFERLSKPKEFRLSNGTLMKTQTIKFVNGEGIPVRDLEEMPNLVLYVRAESGPATVRLRVTHKQRQDSGAQSSDSTFSKWLANSGIGQAVGGPLIVILACIGGPILIFGMFKFVFSMLESEAEERERERAVNTLAKVIRRSKRPGWWS